MRRLFVWFLPFGVFALPCPAQAQYGAPGYYYPQSQPVRVSTYPYNWQGVSASNTRPLVPVQWAQPMPPAPPMSYYAQSAPTPPAVPVLPKTLTAPTTSGEPVMHEGDAPKGTPEPIQPPKTQDSPVAPPPVPTLPPSCQNCKAPTFIEGPVVNGPIDDHNGYHPCISLFGDFLYWNVRGGDVPYAQSAQGAPPPAFLPSVPRGAVSVAQPDYAAGFRAGGGWAITDKSWLIGTFTYFRDETTDHAEAIPGNALRPLLAFPTTALSTQTPLTADARYTIDLKMADLDYKCVMWCADNYQISWLAGARYAKLEQDLSVKYDVLGSTTVDTHVNFDGAGVRTGFEGEYKIKCGLFGYGRGVINLLAGNFRASYEQRNVFTGLEASTEISSNRLVPILELEAGIGWECCHGHLRMSAGYYAGSWFNAVTVPTYVQGVRAVDNTTNGDNFRDVLTFDGVVGRIEFRY